MEDGFLEEKIPESKENRSNDAVYGAWFAAYMGADSDRLDASHDIIKAVESDELDHDGIEDRVQKFMQQTGVSSGFCAQCQHLLDHWPDLDRKPEWDYSVGRKVHTVEIEASSRAGCKFCGLILSRLQLDRRLATFRKLEARIEALEHPARSSLTIQNWGGRSASQLDSQLLWLSFPGKEVTHCNSPGGQAKFESHILPITARLWEEPIDCVKLAREWLLGCVQSHKRCDNLSKCDWPSRLISIADDTIQLVETTSWDTIPPYATLSYCWGQLTYGMLTTKSITTFLDGIPSETLPKTLGDAINITRKLGLSFIWVDTLCIIQDQNSDWLKESGRMRSVYGGSHITLAASSASDVSEGFLSTSSNPTNKYTGGFISRIQASRFSRVQNFHSPDVYKEASTTTRLAGRAWAFQEKLLSPRILYFGDHGIFWECRSSIKSQFLPDGFPGKLGSHLVCPENKAWNWRELVGYYSQASLTYDSDRLPALSGIAARQHEVTGDQYLAGLWRKQLISMLPWRCRKPSKRPCWRAPTWSWASINGASVMWHFGNRELEWQARLLEAWTTTVGDNPFGAVVDGEISLACTSLIPVRLHCIDNDDGSNRDDDFTLSGSPPRYFATCDGTETTPLPVFLDCLGEATLDDNELVYLLPIVSGFSGCGILPAMDTDASKPKGEGVDSGSAEDQTTSYRKELFVAGIVIRSVPTRTQGSFTRLGSFRLSSMPFFWGKHDPNDFDFHQEFIRIARETSEEMVMAACANKIPSDEHTKQEYVITIK